MRDAGVSDAPLGIPPHTHTHWMVIEDFKKANFARVDAREMLQHTSQ